ncbi:hypothetical protein MKX03_025432 [Papaver bracteatum]|nr:hypothetical protein MKX03_025432 [Papaver bracteatum]
MNREPANKSMGFFGMYQEASKITFSRKKIFSQISLAILLPIATHLLSSIQSSYFIGYRNIYAIFNLFMILMSISTVVYTVACIYTSRDITYMGVIRVFPKVWGRLIVTFLWSLLIWALCAGVAIGLFLWFFLSFWYLVFGICVLIPFVIGSIYMEIVWTVAMVISVLEDDYGRKALGKSMKLIKGEVWGTNTDVLLVLHVASSGVILAFSLLVVYGDMLSLERKMYVAIACSLLLMVLIHFTLLIQTIFYFVCKSYHNEDLSNVAKHLDVGYANLGDEKGGIELRRPSV